MAISFPLNITTALIKQLVEPICLDPALLPGARRERREKSIPPQELKGKRKQDTKTDIRERTHSDRNNAVETISRYKQNMKPNGSCCPSAAHVSPCLQYSL
ncbi:hypothetical protein GQ43DRAFT_147234 [Delitschia confertaspora ATCC 74209]|uniref:Uncharacterized protein n=1 Tax=Delitschia confertaspora ATCC 74209 TaxID=1513339 RepID=A0A9P4JUG4_9PLEO|nr:hypothetical protein GQ43DRAFT_147234 [Delitschia confertaspora ATCC 74209]